MISSIGSRCVAKVLPYSLPTFSRPHRLSVGALSQQSSTTANVDDEHAGNHKHTAEHF